LALKIKDELIQSRARIRLIRVKGVRCDEQESGSSVNNSRGRQKRFTRRPISDSLVDSPVLARWGGRGNRDEGNFTSETIKVNIIQGIFNEEREIAYRELSVEPKVNSPFTSPLDVVGLKEIARDSVGMVF
jgi:hypothetical protein